MKPSKFAITFATGITTYLSAMNRDSAVILAQAEQINAGNDKTVSKVEIFNERMSHWRELAF